MTWLLHLLGLESDADVAGIVESTWVAVRDVSPALFWLLIPLGLAGGALLLKLLKD